MNVGLGSHPGDGGVRGRRPPGLRLGRGEAV